jgi:hypothetical protein
MTIITRRTALCGIGALSATAAAGAALAHAGANLPGLTPDERIEAAMAEIASAMRDKYPRWQVQEPVSEIIHPWIGSPMTRRIEPCRHAVLCYAYEPRHDQEERASFMVRYPETEARYVQGRAS